MSDFWPILEIKNVFTIVVLIVCQRANRLHTPVKYWTLIDLYCLLIFSQQAFQPVVLLPTSVK